MIRQLLQLLAEKGFELVGRLVPGQRTIHAPQPFVALLRTNGKRKVAHAQPRVAVDVVGEAGESTEVVLGDGAQLTFPKLLQKAGYQLVVNDVRREAAAPHLAMGGVFACVFPVKPEAQETAIWSALTL